MRVHGAAATLLVRYRGGARHPCARFAFALPCPTPPRSDAAAFIGDALRRGFAGPRDDPGLAARPGLMSPRLAAALHDGRDQQL